MKAPTCPKCQSIYTLKIKEFGQYGKQPFLLHCGHTFCETCLQKLPRKEDCINCPTCQVPTKAPSGQPLYKPLRLDIYILGLIWAKQLGLEQQADRVMWEDSKKKRKTDVKSVQKTGTICGECKVQPASLECRQCEDKMCKQCFDKVHKMSFSLQRHQALPFFAVSEERSAETKTRSRTCLVHEHCQIEYFCKEDNKAICSRCVIVGDHKGHDVQTMEDKNKDTLIYIEPAIRVAQETLWRLNKAEKSLTDVFPYARRDTKELEEQIRTHFQELHSLIQTREQQLLDEIKAAFTSVGDMTQEMKAYICEEKCMLEAAIQDGLRTLQGSMHRLVDADLVLERLEHAKNVSCVIRRDGEGCVNNHIRFLHEEFQPLKESILKYGSISVTSSQMFELRLPGPDDEKPPSEECCLPNVSDVDSLSFTESESLADSASVIIEEEKEELCGAEEVKPKMAVYPSLKPMIPGHYERVQVTHIRTPGQFFVQQLSKVGELEMLSRQLNSYCRSSASKKDPIGVLVPGDRVLAQFSEDKMWYRAVVNNIVPAEKTNKEEDSFVVFYIDYGNCEITTMKSLRKAHKNFFKAPSFALECALHDISPSDKQEGWSRESVEMMLQMTVSGPMIMTVLSQAGNVLEVDLSCPEIDKNCSDDRPVSVRDSLVFLEAAIFKSGSSAEAKPGRIKRDFLTLPRFLDGKLLDIIVTCANTPQSIYAQRIISTESYLHHLEQRMLELYSQESKGLYTVFCPRKGMICAAQYGQDKLWYRARILDTLGGRRLLVQFVDYGNTEIIHHTEIRKILDDDIKFPEQAIECCLSDVEPADGNNEWSEEARAWISRQVFQKVCQFRVTTDSTKSNSVSGALYAIDIDSGRLVCINSELVKHGFASSTGKWSQPPRSETFEGVTLTAREQSHHLQVPENDKAVSKTQKSHPSPGQRSSLSSDVFIQAVSSCSTQASIKGRGVSPDQGVSQKVETYRSNGVLLQQNGTSPGQQSLPTALNDEKPSIHSVAVRISEYQSPGHFYIQLQDKSRQLDSMMTEMSEYNSTDQMDREWKVGDYCAARYSKDQNWYRGRVRRNLEDGNFEVFLVDYGFTDILSRSQLRLLLKRHGKNECFAERCHLAGIQSAGSSDPSKWTSTSREFMMKQITQGKQLFVKLEGEAVPELGLPVDIVVEEVVPETAFDPAFKKYVSLIDLLLGQGLALPVKGRKRSSPASDTGSCNPEQCFQAKVPISASSPVSTVHESNTQDSLESETVVLIQPDFDVAPHPPPSASAMVVVPVYVDYCGVIFAHDVTEEEILSRLIKNMDQYAQHEAPKGRLEVKPGQICLAHYSADNVWYRARVLEVDMDNVKVKYIDFGNIAYVSREKLKLATADICKIPQLALQLVLHNIRPNTSDWSWPTPVLEYMHAEIVNYKCTAEVKSGSPAQQHKGDGGKTQIEVNLVLSNGRSLNDILLDTGMVVPKNNIEDLYQRTADISHVLKNFNPYFSVNLGEVEDTVQVLVTHLDLPDLVYLQRFSPELDAPLSEDTSSHLTVVQKSLRDFITLMDDLNNLPSQTPAFNELPVPGVMCCAKYSLDGRWYRGLVVKSYPASNTVLIFYVDYGNSEIISLQGLRVLPQRFQDTEAQAVRAHLNLSLPQGNRHWTLDLYKNMAEAIYIKCHWAKIKNTAPLTVELYTDNPDESTSSLSYESLIKEGLIVSSSL